MIKIGKTELKTLKDLEVCGCCQVEDQEEYGCMKPQLKAEAIKWIKERMFLPVPKGVEPRVHHAYMRGEREFIKHFFNITEEDLK